MKNIHLSGFFIKKKIKKTIFLIEKDCLRQSRVRKMIKHLNKLAWKLSAKDVRNAC